MTLTIKSNVLDGAFNCRLKIWHAKFKKQNTVKRSRVFGVVLKVNGRFTIFQPEAFMRSNYTKKGRSWISAAPRSPAAHWLTRQRYEQLPF